VDYIWARPGWPKLDWDEAALARPLAVASLEQGRLQGRMEALGFDLRQDAHLRALTEDVVRSSAIEGETLDPNEVRSSIARRLGMDIAGLVPSGRQVDGVVEMLLDATERHDQPLTRERLFDWHAALFPTGRSGMTHIVVGAWRTDSHGPMQVVSGPVGRERVHYEAPPAARLDAEMDRFLAWFEAPGNTHPLLVAGLAHFWFVTLHPFADGNGRIARAVADMALSRSEGHRQRSYSMSAQIQKERKDYYAVLERTQKGTMDITVWQDWFLNCLYRALKASQAGLATVLAKARFWDRYAREALNDRQILLLNKLLDGFEGKLTSSKWAKIAKCSQDTATRDINDLVQRGALRKDPGGGRSTSYSLVID
jgi:Fic family protein